MTERGPQGRIHLVGLCAPVLLLTIALAATWTAFVGDVPMALAVVLVVAALVGFLWLLSRAPAVPRTFAWLSIGALFLGAFLLQGREAYGPIVAAVALALVGYVLRRPPLPKAPEPRWNDVALDPHDLAPRPEPAAHFSGIDLPRPDSSARPLLPESRVPLTTRGMLLAMVLLGAGLLALGGYTAWSGIAGTNGLDGEPVGRVLGVLFGVMFGGFGLLFAVVGASNLLIPTAAIVVDRTGIRRTGGKAWEVAWTDVEGVGVVMNERLVFTSAPTPEAVRRRRDLRIVFALRSSSPGSDAMWPNRWPSPPFTHADRLPDRQLMSRRSVVAEDLDAALRTHVPDLYVGHRVSR